MTESDCVTSTKRKRVNGLRESLEFTRLRVELVSVGRTGATQSPSLISQSVEKGSGAAQAPRSECVFLRKTGRLAPLRYQKVTLSTGC